MQTRTGRTAGAQPMYYRQKFKPKLTHNWMVWLKRLSSLNISAIQEKRKKEKIGKKDYKTQTYDWMV